MNIFVAKLNYRTREDALRDLFEAYGEVSSVKIIMDRDTNRSKGFGFVEMENDSEGDNAISELDGTNFDGQDIVVKKARPRTEYNNNRGGGGGRGRY
jgi:RNA recognition motif-containing protein